MLKSIANMWIWAISDPPRKVPKNHQNGPSKRHLPGSPNLDFDRFRLDPPFLCGLGSETVPKMIENRFQNGHQNGPQKDIKKNHEKASKTTAQNWTLFPTCLISEREARQNISFASAWWWHVVANRCLLSFAATLCLLSSLRALNSLRSLARCARSTKVAM